MTTRYTLSKQERLSSQKVIDSLFSEGRSFFIYPLRVVYRRIDRGNYPVSVAFSVSKRAFRKSVSRNLLKRRMREAYRLNKEALYYPPMAPGDPCEAFANTEESQDNMSGVNSCLAVMFIYAAREIANYQVIEKSMRLVLSRLARQ